MHATLEELLMRRDQQPVAATVEAHLQACETCRAELARLVALQAALQRLPDPSPPADVFRRVRAELANGHGARRWPALASAAAVLVVVLSAFFAVTQRGRVPPAGTGGVEALVARSQHLEALLDSLPPRPPAEQAATSATIDALQSRIELLDAQLSRAAAADSQPQLVERLWNDRVQLLNSLVYVRYAEAAGDPRGPVHPLELGVI